MKIYGNLHLLLVRQWKPRKYLPHHYTNSDSQTCNFLSLNPSSIDAKWRLQRHVSTTATVASTEATKLKKFILPMFPYPSGNLHMGHIRVYTISDVLARFNRMCGHQVMHPIAWDAFGLPAENAAVERGIDPAKWTKQNIQKMREQLMAMNASFDWEREFMTCDSDFYKHTQRLFLLFLERGLAYQAESIVNYDPVDGTVLANEQVDANGRAWRSGAKAEKRMLKQWFLRITALQQPLLDDLEYLSRDNQWPERVLSMQRNWIGKSKGAKIKFPLLQTTNGPSLDTINVFTTRPDTLFGVQYLALSVTHPLVLNLAKESSQLRNFLQSLSTEPADSKAGFLLPSVQAKNPLSLLDNLPKLTSNSLPVYVAPYVLGNYGEGAVMGVPGHDLRDRAFWKQNCGDAPIYSVVEPNSKMGLNSTAKYGAQDGETVEQPGTMNSSCGRFRGMTSTDVSNRIIEELSKLGSMAEACAAWRLRDWLVSRQRYWGTPIPVIHCGKCGTVPVPLEMLPVKLPAILDYWAAKKPGNPLEHAEDWINTDCPRCGCSARRETDTMDTFMDSSWYYMRFMDYENTKEPFSPQIADANLPVDLYVGGVEHAILHLLYARFMAKVLAASPLWPSGSDGENRGEPFRRLVTQGMVHGKTYSEPQTKRFLKPEELDLSEPTKPKILESGQMPLISWEKMSKSKYNGVDPTECIKRHGADVVRAHILFQAPVSEVLEWEEKRIVGIERWFGRLRRLVDDVQDRLTGLSGLKTGELEPSGMDVVAKALPLPSLSSFPQKESELWLQLHRCVVSVTQSLSESFALNTVISDLMELTNHVISAIPATTPAFDYHATSVLLRLLAPVAPDFSEQCWTTLHKPFGSQTCDQSKWDSIFSSPFPKPDKTLGQLRSRSQICVVQENGKRRFTVEIPNVPEYVQGEKAVEEWITKQVRDSQEMQTWMAKSAGKNKKSWKRVVVARGGKIINFVG